MIAHPNPEFIKELFVLESATIGSTAGAWTNQGEPFALNKSLLFMNGISSAAIEVRIVQGRIDSNGNFVPLHYGTAWPMLASNAANETFKTETAMMFARIQVKSSSSSTVSLVVSGRLVS
jgi:hypothetical protein